MRQGRRTRPRAPSRQVGHRSRFGRRRQRCAVGARARNRVGAASPTSAGSVAARTARPSARRIGQQPGASDVGPGRHGLRAGRGRALRGRDQRDRRRPRTRGTSATGSSTTSARTCSPRTTSRSGDGRGASSSTTTSACATRRRPSRAPIAVRQRATRSSRSRTTSARSTSPARPPRPAPASTTPRQQVNTISSYIDASDVYGVDDARSEWERRPGERQPVDNGAALLLPGGYLPTVGARGNAATAPRDGSDGPADGEPRPGASSPVTCAPTRTSRSPRSRRCSPASTTASSRRCPASLSRRARSSRSPAGWSNAEEQYITYNEFLPALGVRLAAVPRLQPAREREPLQRVRDRRLPRPQHGARRVRRRLRARPVHAGRSSRRSQQEGVAVTDTADHAHAHDPAVASRSGTRIWCSRSGSARCCRGLGGEHQYKNDEQIDNTMRSVLFEVPKPGTTDPAACQTPVVDPRCFSDVADLGADDIERGRDHGMPRYNDMRRAYGLPAVHSFTQMTGETTDQFPPVRRQCATDQRAEHPRLHAAAATSTGTCIDPTSPDAQEDAVTGVRRTTLAARLKAIYGSRRQASTRSSAWCRSRTCRAPSSARSSSRSGRSSSPRSATATGSSTPTTRSWPRSMRTSASTSTTRWPS